MVVGIVRKVVSSVLTMSRPQVIFVLGAPGAGKGTQCQKIVDTYGYVHLSAGDLLREERQNPGSQYGDLIDNYIKEGKIVPVEITCSLLEAAMEKSDKNNFLIDGFPRNQDNLDGWQKQVAPKVNLLFVLFFECPEEVAIQRCLARGAAGSGRSDDNLDSLKKRFNTYVTETQAIINYYKERDLVKSVDATKSRDAVFADVKAFFTAATIGAGDN